MYLSFDISIEFSLNPKPFCNTKVNFKFFGLFGAILVILEL